MSNPYDPNRMGASLPEPLVAPPLSASFNTPYAPQGNVPFDTGSQDPSAMYAPMQFSGYSSGVASAGSNSAMPQYQPVPDPVASTGNKTGDFISTGSKILGALPGIGSVISGLSAVGGVIMNWWNADKQIEAQKAAQRDAKQAYAEQMAESKRRYDTEIGLKREEMKSQKEQFLMSANMANRVQASKEKMDAATLKANAEQKYWDRWVSLMSNLTNMMSTPGSRSATAQLYKR